MLQEKFVKKLKTHILRSATQKHLPENRAVYEIMWKYMVEADRPQMTIKYCACVLHAE
jgi:hypothetical protein